ncbi:MAG: septum formation initiator family protein [Mariprofundaceae bacterium]|nr:septum formation initiator family protein [Mariprofundaceae bacterium]
MLAAAILAFVWMSWELIFSDHGYRVYQGERAQLEKLEYDLKALKIKREWLAKEILRLRNDPAALEELVHRELGYVYPDEYMLIIPERNTKQGAGD